MNLPPESRKIMVIDDEAADRRLLEQALGRKGYEVQTCSTGLLALAAAVQNPPDLILLDVVMPGIGGYEVCNRLKADASLASIPVIFLSVLDDPDDKVKAFRHGAADYISKPLHLEEMNARVETHLRLNHLQKAMAAQNEHLEEAVALRTRELAEAHAELKIVDRAKDDFLRTIAHELRTPLHGLLGASEIAFDDLPPSPKNDRFRELYEQSRQRMISLLDDAMLLTQIDVNGRRFSSTPVRLSAVLELAVRKATEFAETRHVTLQAPPLGPENICGHLELLVRAFHAMLDTAVKLSKQGGTLRLTREAESDSMRVIIDSDGGTLPAKALPKFFDIFAIGEQIASGADLGLGPAVASRILSLFGSTVAVENRDDSGIRLTIEFKRVQSGSS